MMVHCFVFLNDLLPWQQSWHLGLQVAVKHRKACGRSRKTGGTRELVWVFSARSTRMQTDAQFGWDLTLHVYRIYMYLPT